MSSDYLRLRSIDENSVSSSADLTTLVSSNASMQASLTSLDSKKDLTESASVNAHPGHNVAYRDNTTGYVAKTLRMARNQITGSMTAFQDLVLAGHNWQSTLGATTLFQISSSNGADASPAGNGLREVKVYYREASGNYGSVTTLMNGQTSVNIGNTAIGIERVTPVEVGGLRTNQGDIHIYKNGTAITGGVPNSDNSKYMNIPTDKLSTDRGSVELVAGDKIYLKKLSLSHDSDGSVSVEIRLEDLAGAAFNLQRIWSGVVPAGVSAEFDLSSVPVIDADESDLSNAESALNVYVQDNGTAAAHNIEGTLDYVQLIP